MEKFRDRELTTLEKLEMLDLPAGSFMVMGSGILGALGIRQAKDVDMVVSQEVYTQLKASGWSERVFRSGEIEQLGLEHDVFQVFQDWTDDDGSVKLLEELLADADVVSGVAYNSLDKLYAYKLRRGLSKDLADLSLIDSFLREA